MIYPWKSAIYPRKSSANDTISSVDPRLIIAIFIGKIIAFLTKLTGSGATAAPGLYALKIDPSLVKKLSNQIQHGSIIISGTNGKTTTARLTSDILSTKFNVIHNRQGSNLLRGIASTLISKSSLLGKINENLALWEVDEATLPEAIENTNPQVVVLLNLFRDQLDRYGEVDIVRNKWQKILEKLPKSTTLILNADDPGISILANNFRGKVIFFGVNDKKINLPEISHVADIRHCLACGSNLEYSTLLSAHMGHYKCPSCNFKRPSPRVTVSNLKFNRNFSTSGQFSIFNLRRKYQANDIFQFSIHYNLPGLYNVYNVLAATAVARIFKIKTSVIKKSLENFTAAFGRFQSVQIRNKSVLIFLTKNPTGTNEVLRTIATKNKINLLAILNDKIADGRDVSWIWDTNWEILKEKIKILSVSGTRAWDLATRFKYAGFNLSKKLVDEDISYSINSTVKNLHNKDTLSILTTYTALLEVQKTLSKMGSTQWHEQ
ncbi:DUF1727 domain-containing protein [Candidatus Curtissbacteria bacterium]|nr:DUF1727 domain-containing protein [Candidatus Curtissbacteria bacterium]